MALNANPSPIPGTSNEKGQILNENQGSISAQGMPEISWDSEDVPDGKPLSSSQQTAFETFKKSFTNFSLSGSKN